MTLAYTADALIYDVERDGYALRPDFDPRTHCVDIAFGRDCGWSPGTASDWNAPEDPPLAHVRALNGAPIDAGHAYAADRFAVTAPNGGSIWIDLVEIDHDPVGFVSEEPLSAGIHYPVRQAANPREEQERQPIATGFGAGTMITTRQGDLPVEWLAAGDEIATLDGGMRHLRWIGHTRFSARDLARNERLRPVRLNRSHFGQGDCGPDLWVAQDVQAMLTGPEISLNFGLDDALGRAVELSEGSNSRDLGQNVTYFMLLFDEHVMMRANGAWCASLFVDARSRSGLLGQFPTFPDDIRHDRYALPCLTDGEVRMIRMEKRLRIPRRTVAAA